MRRVWRCIIAALVPATLACCALANGARGDTPKPVAAAVPDEAEARALETSVMEETIAAGAEFQEGEDDPSAVLAAGEPEPEASPPTLVGDSLAGASKAAVCMGCHGPDGNALAPMFPKLAGQRSDYIAKQLRDFREGRRFDPIMIGMAAGLSDQDVLDLAAHFEARRVQVGTWDPGLARAGERIYREGRPADGLPACIGCHGPNGEGFNGSIEGGFPAIGGQHRDYLVKQLQGFRSESRSNDWRGIMRFVASQLSDRDIEELAAYLVGLSRGGGDRQLAPEPGSGPGLAQAP